MPFIVWDKRNRSALGGAQPLVFELQEDATTHVFGGVTPDGSTQFGTVEREALSGTPGDYAVVQVP